MPDSVRNKIATAQNELRHALPSGAARWTKVEQFHLTLRFLGAVAAGRFPALTEGVRLACQNFAPLQLRAEHIGFFPDQRFPRVIWVGIDDLQGRLPLLQRAVQSATQEFTNETAEKTFTGHVTLGRIKQVRPKEAQSLAAAATNLANTHFGDWTANHIDIMRSELSSEGAKHSSLAAAPLDFAGL
jgi:2'-5' RNA ligase